MADTDATADQGAEGWYARLKAAAQWRRRGVVQDARRPNGSGKSVERLVQEAAAFATVPSVKLPDLEATLAALPLQASCVGLMEEVVEAWEKAADPFVLDERVTQIVSRYLTLKSAQESANG